MSKDFEFKTTTELRSMTQESLRALVLETDGYQNNLPFRA